MPYPSVHTRKATLDETAYFSTQKSWNTPPPGSSNYIQVSSGALAFDNSSVRFGPSANPGPLGGTYTDVGAIVFSRTSGAIATTTGTNGLLRLYGANDGTGVYLLDGRYMGGGITQQFAYHTQLIGVGTRIVHVPTGCAFVLGNSGGGYVTAPAGLSLFIRGGGTFWIERWGGKGGGNGNSTAPIVLQCDFVVENGTLVIPSTSDAAMAGGVLGSGTVFLGVTNGTGGNLGSQSGTVTRNLINTFYIRNNTVLGANTGTATINFGSPTYLQMARVNLHVPSQLISFNSAVVCSSGFNKSGAGTINVNGQQDELRGLVTCSAGQLNFTHRGGAKYATFQSSSGITWAANSAVGNIQGSGFELPTTIVETGWAGDDCTLIGPGLISYSNNNLTKKGTGTWTLSPTTVPTLRFSTTLVVDAGAVRVASDPGNGQALGAISAGVTVNAAGTVWVNAYTNKSSATVTWYGKLGSDQPGTRTLNAGTLVVGSTVTLDAVTDAKLTVVAGAVTASSTTINKTGGGDVTLTWPSYPAGELRVSGGVLALDPTKPVPANVVLSGTGTLKNAKLSSGSTLQISGSPTVESSADAASTQPVVVPVTATLTVVSGGGRPTKPLGSGVVTVEGGLKSPGPQGARYGGLKFKAGSTLTLGS